MKKQTIENSMFFNASPEIYRKAEYLRKNMTEAEKLLWDRLRKTQLGVRFKAQHPIDQFIVDFYCHKAKLVIEVDGDNHRYNQEYDEGREAEIKKFGIKIIRFTNNEIFEDLNNVIKKIRSNI
jgi:very-short-patch-repair endonuclease